MDIVLRDFIPEDVPWLVDQHGTHYAQAEGFDASFGALVAEILAASHADPDGVAGLVGSFDAERLARIEELELDPVALSQIGKRYERLDQLAMEHLLGVRG